MKSYRAVTHTDFLVCCYDLKPILSSFLPPQTLHEISTTITLQVSKLKQLWMCQAYNKNLLRNHFYSYSVTQRRSAIVSAHPLYRLYNSKGIHRTSPVLQEEMMLII